MNTKFVKWFEKVYRARVRPSIEKWRTPQYHHGWDFEDRNIQNSSFQTYDEECVEIIMTKKDFYKMAEVIEEYHSLEGRLGKYQYFERQWGSDGFDKLIKIKVDEDRESSIREKNEALKKAWEQYKMLLALHG